MAFLPAITDQYLIPVKPGYINVQNVHRGHVDAFDRESHPGS